MTTSHTLTEALGAAAWPDSVRARGRLAAELALTVYRGHVRDQGTPYLDHPVRVVAVLRHELGVTAPDTLVLGLLHDALEVSATAEPLITEALGPDLVRHLRAMTPDHRLERRPKHPNDAAAWRAKLHALTPEELLVRLADRIDNLRDLANSPGPGRRAPFLAALTDVYLPLAKAARARSPHHRAAYALLLAEYRNATAEGIS